MLVYYPIPKWRGGPELALSQLWVGAPRRVEGK